MRAPPTTLEIIEPAALRRPERPAIHEDGQSLAYGHLYGMAYQCTRELHALGLRPGQRVAVAGPSVTAQLILLLACEALGAVTLSFIETGDPDAEAVFTQVDWVLSFLPQPVPASTRFVQLDQAFIDRLKVPLGQGPRPWHSAELDEPQRITRTSGSTGRSRFMVLSRRAQEFWVRNAADGGYSTESRVWLLSPLVLNATFGRASRCLRAGALVVVGGPAQLQTLVPTQMVGLPLHLDRFLQGVPPDWQAPHPVEVLTMGGNATPALRERVQQVFGRPMAVRYGCNEAGGFSEDLDAGSVGVLSPGVEVRLVGPDGADLPPGAVGTFWFRTSAMADGYLDDPEASAAAFRDGWFVTSDVGALVGHRRIHLLGRQDDLVNVGGAKVPASQIEAAISRQPAIAECAVVGLNLAGGAVTLGVAIRLAPGAAPQDASAQLQGSLELGQGAQARLVFMERLPRLLNGKIDRLALQQLFLAQPG